MTKLGLKTDLKTAGDFLAQTVELLFYNTLVAIQGVRENLIRNGEASKEVQSINELVQLFNHTD